MSCFSVLNSILDSYMVMRMATKQPKVLIPLQLILIVITLYGVRQLQHCKLVTDIYIDITTMTVSFGNNPLRSNISKYRDWTKSKPNPSHHNLLVMALFLSGDVQQNPCPVKFPYLECKNQLPRPTTPYNVTSATNECTKNSKASL